MIEKLKFHYRELSAREMMSNTVLWESIISQRTEQLQDKINEIIDHLPQEKEPQPVPPTLCNACHREIYAEGEPTKEYPLCPRCKTPTVARAHMTSNDKRSLYCVNGNCTYDVPFEELTTPILKPTKEQQEKEPVKFNIQSMDARVWAKEFNRILVTKNEQPYDEEWLIGWFANAIMAGYDEATRRVKQPTKEVDITCNEASFCIYKFQNGSLCGCKFKDWCAYQTPQIDRKPTKEVPDIRPILEKLVRDSGSINWTEPLINQAIQEISALYRKDFK